MTRRRLLTDLKLGESKRIIHINIFCIPYLIEIIWSSSDEKINVLTGN
jgi:hypothetical protein